MGLSAADLEDADVIITKLQERCNAGRNCHDWLQQFASRVQRDSESVDNWLSDLRASTRKCEFEMDFCGACQNTRLLGQIIFGVFDDDMRRKLLELGARLTLEKAITIIRTAEVTRLQSSNMNQGNTAPFHQIKSVIGKRPSDNMPIHRRVSPAVNHLFDGTLPVVNRMVAGAVEHLHTMLRRNVRRSERNVIRATNRVISSPCAPKVVRRLDLKRPVASLFSPSFKTWSGSVSPLPAAPRSLSFRCFRIPEHPSMPFQLVYIGVSSRISRYLLMDPSSSSGPVVTSVHVLQDLQQPVISKAKQKKLGMLPAQYPHACVLAAILSSKSGVLELSDIQSTMIGLMAEVPSIFDGVCRPMRGAPCHFQLKEDAVPSSISGSRPISVPLMPKVKRELDSLEKQHVIAKDLRRFHVSQPVHHQADFRGTDSLSTIPSGMKFLTVIDALNGYHQVELDDESSLMTTISTPFGRYKYLRLPFGVSLAGDDYDRRLADVFDDFTNCRRVVEDVLVFLCHLGRSRQFGKAIISSCGGPSNCHQRKENRFCTILRIVRRLHRRDADLPWPLSAGGKLFRRPGIHAPPPGSSITQRFRLGMDSATRNGLSIGQGRLIIFIYIRIGILKPGSADVPLRRCFSSPRNKLNNPWILRLCLSMQRYSFTASWVPGKHNFNADALSRSPVDQPCPSDEIAEGPHSASERIHLMDEWDITHGHSSPHHPRSNGHAETAVKSMKKLIAGSWTSGSFDLDKFGKGLILFRNAPIAGCASSSQVVFNRPTRDIIPAHRRSFAPEWQKAAGILEKRALRARELRTQHYNHSIRLLPALCIVDSFVIQHHRSKCWTTPWVIVEVGAFRDYFVKTPAGRLLFRNRRFLRLGSPSVVPNSPSLTPVDSYSLVAASSQFTAAVPVPAASADTSSTGPRRSTQLAARKPNRTSEYILYLSSHLSCSFHFIPDDYVLYSGLCSDYVVHRLQLVIKDGFKTLSGEAAGGISYVEIQTDATLLTRLTAIKKHGPLTAYQQMVLKEIVAIRKPFEAASNDFQADFETASITLSGLNETAVVPRPRSVIGPAKALEEFDAYLKEDIIDMEVPLNQMDPNSERCATKPLEYWKAKSISLSDP
ncbi:Uncharacterized protein APZ42_017711 [Daphnia magna]|uniref:Integrase catalytic domain-containing protein n=1 Tax=Daphnia magna TaxID=35525 RepID=A0A164ZN25_9CRUS|nr:Uncharacterized protein APZ42_017711 [Daphnia magna]